MLDALPNETTQLLIDICTSTTPLTFDPEDRPTSPVKQATATSTTASYLSYLAISRGAAPIAPSPLVASDLPQPSSASTITATTVKPSLETARKDSIVDGSRDSTPPPPSATSTNGTTTGLLSTSKPQTLSVKRPSPRLYFPNFVGHREQFVVFLEAVALKRWGQTMDENVTLPSSVDEEPGFDEQAERKDQEAVWNTLLELYLTLSGVGEAGSEGQVQRKGQGKSAMGDKALKLLKDDKIPYDPTHALILCSTRKFTSGLVLLWERLGMYEDVLRFWMDKDQDPTSAAEASGEVMRCLEKYGPKNKYLYPLVLRFLTSSGEVMSRHKEDLREVLDVIDQETIMPPLAVVQVLSRNGVTSVGLVKDWLMGRIKEARDEINTVRLILFCTTPKLNVFLCNALGPTTYRVVPWRDGDKAQTSQRAFRSRSSKSIPCRAVFALWRPARSPECAFYV